MRVILILVLAGLAGVTSFEVYEAVVTAKKWHSYENKIFAQKEKPCPDPQVIIQRVEYNPINDLNLDSFMQVYGITPENIHPKSNNKKSYKKSETLIEPKKIVPDTHKFRIKINKVK